MLTALNFLVVGFVMKVVSRVLDDAFNEIAHQNFVGSIIVVAAGVLYLLVSFLRHRTRTANA